MLRSIYWKARWLFFWKNFQLPVIDYDKVVPNPDYFDPPIKDKLCMPPYEGPNQHNDVSPLLTFIKFFEPRFVLELGTAHGSTTANICSICNTRIYTVNALPEQITGNLITSSLTRDEIGSVYRNYGFENRVVQIYENTKELNPLNYIEPGCIDIVIIDACHDIDFVISDFLMIQPVIHKKSVVFFHDVHPSLNGHLADSYLACMYLRKIGYNILHLHNTWWGIWRAGGLSSKPHEWVKVINTVDNRFIKVRRRSILKDAKNIKYFFDTQKGFLANKDKQRYKISTLQPILYSIREKLKRNPDRFLREISGLIHVGANTGQERELYKEYGLRVIWIEPIPEVFEMLKANLKGYQNQHAIQCLITDRDNEVYQFNIADNNGASSSILDLKKHKDIWPDVNYTNTIPLISTTLASLFQREQIEPSEYQSLIVDTQGSELLVLKGCIPLLKHFKYIKTEVPDFESYAGCCQLTEINLFMTQHGYKEFSRHKFASRTGGGSYYDIVYQRKS